MKRAMIAVLALATMASAEVELVGPGCYKNPCFSLIKGACEPCGELADGASHFDRVSVSWEEVQSGEIIAHAVGVGVNAPDRFVWELPGSVTGSAFGASVNVAYDSPGTYPIVLIHYRSHDIIGTLSTEVLEVTVAEKPEHWCEIDVSPQPTLGRYGEAVVSWVSSDNMTHARRRWNEALDASGTIVTSNPMRTHFVVDVYSCPGDWHPGTAKCPSVMCHIYREFEDPDVLPEVDATFTWTPQQLVMSEPSEPDDCCVVVNRERVCTPTCARVCFNLDNNPLYQLVQWRFGDGRAARSISTHPCVIYQSPGDYTVTATVSDYFSVEGVRTATHTATITIDE